MILPLVVQYNYNNTVTVAEPIASSYFDYYEVATAETLDEAKEKAYKYYANTDYKLLFISEGGDELWHY